MQLVFDIERNKKLKRTEVLIQQEDGTLADAFYIDDCIDSRWVYKDKEYISLIIKRTIASINAFAKAEGENIEISIRHRD